MRNDVCADVMNLHADAFYVRRRYFPVGLFDGFHTSRKLFLIFCFILLRVSYLIRNVE